MKTSIKAVGTEKPMPLEIRPMMAQSSPQPFDNPDWIFEMKWDGCRAKEGPIRFSDAIKGQGKEFSER